MEDEKLTTVQKVEVAGLLYLTLGGVISVICYLFGVEWVVKYWSTPIIGLILIALAIGPIVAGVVLMEKGKRFAGEAIIFIWAVILFIVSR